MAGSTVQSCALQVPVFTVGIAGPAVHLCGWQASLFIMGVAGTTLAFCTVVGSTVGRSGWQVPQFSIVGW